MTRQTQINTANQLLAQNLSTLTFEQLVNLCLVKKANPTALPSFGRSLQAELIRRYDEQAITQNPAEFAVLQNFANTFADPVGEFEHALRTMHTQINKDVWFNNNREYFIRIINDLTGVKVLIDNQELLASGVHNAIARLMILDSYPLVEAVVVNSTAFELLLSPPSVWAEIAQSANTMTIFAKSSQIIDRIIITSVALQAVIASSTAMTAVAASSTAMTAVAASSTAIDEVNKSEIALEEIYKVSTKFTKSNSGWQGQEIIRGNYWLVRIKTLSNPAGWSEGYSGSEYIQLNGKSFATTHFSSAGYYNIKSYRQPKVQHNGLKSTEGGQIYFYMYNPFEIAYIKIGE